MGKASQSTPVPCILVHPNSIYRLGLRSVLAQVPGLHIVEEKNSLKQALPVVGRCSAQVMVVDIPVNSGNSLKFCRTLVQRFPRLKLMVLLPGPLPPTLYRTWMDNVHGMVLQTVETNVLLAGMKKILKGKRWSGPGVQGRMKVESLPKILSENRLSEREQQAMILVGKGYTNRQIGKEMGLSEKTVKNYLANVFQKLNVKRRAHAATRFVRHYPSQRERGEVL